MVQVDFTAPAGRELYDELLGEAYANGYDGWMEDFGEYTPLDAHGHDGSVGWDWHNRYVTDFHCAAHDFADRQDRPLARYVRSGWTGTAPCAPIVWGGDPTTSWGFDGLESAIYNGLSMGTSGVSTWGSDIGGFFALGDERLTEELLVRWVQFGALTPVMRTQAEGVAIPEKTRPQIWDDGILPHWRRWAKLHTQLNPYLLAATDEYERTGMPVMRHHVLSHPDDSEATARDDQYMFGPDLLVAPVVEPEATERSLHLPSGDWVDLWRSADYDEETGGLVLTGSEVLEGSAAATLAAPLEEMPLLVRAGATLPLLPPDVDTLTDYGRDTDDVVNLVDRLDELHLLAFPSGSEQSAIGVGEHVTSTVDGLDWTLQVDGTTSRTYHLQAALDTGDLGEPSEVLLDGEPLDDWSYMPESGVLTAEFTTHTGTLEVVTSHAAGPEVCTDTPFSDVASNHPHVVGICRVAAEGVTHGFGDETFRPQVDVSRQHVASFVERALEAADVPLPEAGDQGFTDTGRSVHATAIDRLAAAGIVEGVRSGVFRPAEPVTRDQFASMLIRAAWWSGATEQQGPSGGPYFADTAGSVHAGNVDLAFELGLTEGRGPEHFAPRSPATRAQAATFLTRLLDLFGVGPR